MNTGIRKSAAFAAHRQAIITELQQDLHNTLVPAFNAEVVDIRKQYEETVKQAEQCPTEVAKNKLLELADAQKKARIMDLNVRKRDFINALQTDLRMRQLKRVEEYHGEVFIEDEKRDGSETTRQVEKVKFSDGSMAKVAQNLFIQPGLFDRV